MGEALAAAKHSRNGHRGWVTRCLKDVNELAGARPVNQGALSVALSSLEVKFAAWEEAQQKVQLLLPAGDLDKDIDDAYAVMKEVNTAKTQAKQHLEKKIETPPSDQNKRAKLPKLELTRFNGDILAWPSFWQKFNYLVHSSDIPDVDKLTHLDNVLDGEAKASIRGLGIAGGNYSVAIEILEKRFGRKETCVLAHIQHMLSLSTKDGSVKSLWELHDNLRAHLRALEQLGVAGSRYGIVLTPIILSRLPEDVRLEWSRAADGKEGEVEFLLEFLWREVRRRERSETFQDQRSSLTPKSAAPPKKIPSATSLHQTSQKKPQPPAALCPPSTCVVCGKEPHVLDECPSLINATFEDRKKQLQSAKACFKCLCISGATHHDFRRCTAKCSGCAGRHHLILCENAAAAVAAPSPAPAPPEQQQGVSASAVTEVRMQTATSVGRRAMMDRVAVQCLFMCYLIRVLIDHISTSIQPKWVSDEYIAYSTFGSGMIRDAERYDVYNVMLSNHVTSMNVLLTAIPIVCPQLQCPSVPASVVDEFPEVVVDQDVMIDAIIGLDLYWKIITPEVRRLEEGLVAQKTIFGWIVSVLYKEMCNFLLLCSSFVVSMK